MKYLKQKKILAIILLFIAVGILCTLGFTLAKYVSNKVWDYYLESKGFYFYSDNLTSNGFKNGNSSWDGGAVSFNLMNYLNESNVTGFDIEYEVTCTVKGMAASNVDCHLNGTTENSFEGVMTSYQSCKNTTGDNVIVSSYNKTECELNGYSWIYEMADKELSFELYSNDGSEITTATVNISVKSTSPYRKTISGDFILGKQVEEAEGIILEFKDYGEYGRLTISNHFQVRKGVQLNWNANDLIIDEPKSRFLSFTTNIEEYIDMIAFNLDPKESLTYLFYKTDLNTTYDTTAFSFTDSSPLFHPNYVAGIYAGDPTNLYVGGVKWENGRLVLNGVNQGIEIEDNSNYSQGITIVIYFQMINKIDAVQNLIMKRSLNTNGYFMYIDGLTNNRLKIDVGGAATRTETSVYVEVGLAYHIIYAWDPTTKGRLYVNGDLVETSSKGDVTNLNAAGNVPIKTGFDKDGVFSGNKYPLWGEIKAMSIYNIALSPAEVRNIYLRDTSAN